MLEGRGNVTEPKRRGGPVPIQYVNADILICSANDVVVESVQACQVIQPSATDRHAKRQAVTSIAAADVPIRGADHVCSLRGMEIWITASVIPVLG